MQKRLKRYMTCLYHGIDTGRSEAEKHQGEEVGRCLVIKRTYHREGKRKIPVDLGTIGEIINGKYVEICKETRKKQIDTKDYGVVKLCGDCSGDMLQELPDVWDITDAKKLYCIAVLRAA